MVVLESDRQVTRQSSQFLGFEGHVQGLGGVLPSGSPTSSNSLHARTLLRTKDMRLGIIHLGFFLLDHHLGSNRADLADL